MSFPATNRHAMRAVLATVRFLHCNISLSTRGAVPPEDMIGIFKNIGKVRTNLPPRGTRTSANLTRLRFMEPSQGSWQMGK